MNNRVLFLAFFIIAATAGIIFAVNHGNNSDSGQMVETATLTDNG